MFVIKLQKTSSNNNNWYGGEFWENCNYKMGRLKMSNRLNYTDKRRVVQHFHSVKMQSLIYCRSYFELCMFRCFEFDETIIGYVEQPFVTPYLDEAGKLRNYKQDALVRFQQGTDDHVEIKPEANTRSLTFRNKHEILKRHYENLYGSPLKLYTEERYADDFFSNTVSLYRYKAKPINQIESEALDKIATKQLPFSELEATFAAQKIHASTAFRLLAHNALRWDMNIKLNDNTLLEIS
jgi:hypothetical protein